jgi:hypothetical protein
MKFNLPSFSEEAFVFLWFYFTPSHIYYYKCNTKSRITYIQRQLQDILQYFNIF